APEGAVPPPAPERPPRGGEEEPPACDVLLLCVSQRPRRVREMRQLASPESSARGPPDVPVVRVRPPRPGGSPCALRSSRKLLPRPAPPPQSSVTSSERRTGAPPP